jgi:hypothetical protein
MDAEKEELLRKLCEKLVNFQAISTARGEKLYMGGDESIFLG